MKKEIIFGLILGLFLMSVNNVYALTKLDTCQSLSSSDLYVVMAGVNLGTNGGGAVSEISSSDYKSPPYSVREYTSSIGDYAYVTYFMNSSGDLPQYIDNLTSLSFYYKHVSYNNWSGPRFSLLLEKNGSYYIAVSGSANESYTWTKADGITGSNILTYGDNPNDIWWVYGDCDSNWQNCNLSNPLLGSPTNISVIKQNLSGANLEVVTVYLGVVDGTNVGAGETYIDDIEVNGIIFDPANRYVYVVGNDSDCFTISSDNIVLDCNAYNVTNIGSNSMVGGITIDGNTNITIKNCNFDRYYQLYLSNSDDVTIINTTISNSNEGIRLVNANNTNLDLLTVTSTDREAIVFEDGYNITITNSIFNNIGFVGNTGGILISGDTYTADDYHGITIANTNITSYSSPINILNMRDINITDVSLNSTSYVLFVGNSDDIVISGDIVFSTGGLYIKDSGSLNLTNLNINTSSTGLSGYIILLDNLTDVRITNSNMFFTDCSTRKYNFVIQFTDNIYAEGNKINSCNSYGSLFIRDVDNFVCLNENYTAYNMTYYGIYVKNTSGYCNDSYFYADKYDGARVMNYLATPPFKQFNFTNCIFNGNRSGILSDYNGTTNVYHSVVNGIQNDVYVRLDGILNLYNTSIDSYNVEGGQLNVYWQLDVINPLSATVKIYDYLNNLISQFIENKTLWLREYYVTPTNNRTNTTPHTIQATKSGYQDYSTQLTMNTNRELTITLSEIVSLIPTGFAVYWTVSNIIIASAIVITMLVMLFGVTEVQIRKPEETIAWFVGFALFSIIVLTLLSTLISL